MPLDTRQIQPFGPQPTLLDRIHADTVKRAQISQTTRAEDAAQRTQRAYQMLEGIDEQPSTGYGSLFGQRASSQNEFRTVDDAAAYLRATDPQGMQTRQAALGEFMANQALPRLTTVPDPAQRVAVLKQMAASGPPMLNRLVREIGADGVITDDELAQAEGMYGSYKKAPDAGEMPWTVAGSNLVNRATGEFRTPPVPEGQSAYDFGGEAKNLAEAYRALADENAPPAVRQAAQAFISDFEAQRDARRRSNRPRPASGNGGITIEEGEDGQLRVQIGGPAGTTVRNEQARVALAINAVRPQWEQYGALLNDPKLSPSTAGMTGGLLSAVRGVSNQIPLTRQAIQWADRHSPVKLLGENARQARYMANMMSIQLAPVFAAISKGNPSNKDIQRVQEAIGLLGATDDLNTARFAYAYITNYMNTLEGQAQGVVQTGRVPTAGSPPQVRPVPQPGGTAPPTPRTGAEWVEQLKRGGR